MDLAASLRQSACHAQQKYPGDGETGCAGLRQIAARLHAGENLRDLWREYCGAVARPYSLQAFRDLTHAYIRDVANDEPLSSNSPVAEIAERYNYALAYWSRRASPVRDRQGRNSLVSDAIEALRPMIDELVLKFVSKNTFDRSDFIKLGIDKRAGHIRLAPALAMHVLQECVLPQREIDRAAKFMIDLISK